jgi:uncharacterized protein DUF6600
MTLKTRAWIAGIALCGSVAAISCITAPSRTVYVQPPPGQPQMSPVEPEGGSDQPFYDDLSPYGRWVYVSGPGWVWSPSNVQAGWRPYQLGHWVYTDYGWTWSSDEEFGWAVYHYGRWHQDASYGWVWVPGTEWGPAWVAWHEGGGYVGWAPLPWQVTFRAGVGLDWGGVSISLTPASWCFVNARFLVDPGLRGYIEPPTRNVTLIHVTKNITSYTYIDNRVVNQGVTVDRIGRAVGHTIPRYHVSEADSPGLARGGKVNGADFVVFKPNPGLARGSRGRLVPPGHDPAHFQRGQRFGDDRPGADQESQSNQTPPSETKTSPPPPRQENGPPAGDRGAREPRGHRFLDQLMGRKEAPRHVPQGGPPPQPGTPSQPGQVSQPGTVPQPGQVSQPGTVSQPGAPGQGGQSAPPATTSSPAQADRHGAPPANRPDNPGQSQDRPGRQRPNAPRDAATKQHGKPKPEESKPKAPDSDKPKGQGSDSK